MLLFFISYFLVRLCCDSNCRWHLIFDSIYLGHYCLINNCCVFIFINIWGWQFFSFLFIHRASLLLFFIFFICVYNASSLIPVCRAAGPSLSAAAGLRLAIFPPSLSDHATSSHPWHKDWSLQVPCRKRAIQWSSPCQYMTIIMFSFVDRHSHGRPPALLCC